jgi:hypothetical protein
MRPGPPNGPDSGLWAIVEKDAERPVRSGRAVASVRLDVDYGVTLSIVLPMTESLSLT